MLSCTIDGIFVSRLRIKTSTLLLLIGWSKIIIYRFPDNQRVGGAKNIQILYRIARTLIKFFIHKVEQKYFAPLRYVKDKRKVTRFIFSTLGISTSNLWLAHFFSCRARLVAQIA